MANGVDDQSGVDIANMLRQKQILDAMAQAGPPPNIQQQQQQPQLPSFITQPNQFPQPPIQPTTQPAQGPIATPPVTQAPTTPVQPPIPELNLPYKDIQLPDIARITKDASDLYDLMGTKPDPKKFHQSKLLKILMSPVAIMAGMGGMKSSEIREAMDDITRKGFAKAESDYKRKLEAAQEKYGLDKDTVKTMEDLVKEKIDINKQAAEVWKTEIEARSKQAEIKQREQQAEIDKQNIPPLNQALAAIQRSHPDQPLTADDINNEVGKYYAKQEEARLKAEQARLDAAKADREKEDRLKRGEANVAQDIRVEQGRLSETIKPIQNARQAMANLRALRANNDDDGFARLMSVIMTDNALSSAAHGSVRQNIGIIQELIKSPGWLEYLKGKAQGILHPGKGSISDATMQQIDRILDSTDKQLEAEEKAATRNLTDLNGIDPTDPGARETLKGIIGRSYDIPKPDVPKTGDTKTGDASGDTKAKIDALQKEVDKVDAAIKRKLEQKK